METLTIKLPEVLVRDAKEAADKLGMSLNRFMMQAIFIRVQELPTMGQ
jgi:predicted HicB family RNase H-like nuclease